MATNNEIILETKLVGDIKGEFYVPSYQRGYRWGADEVIRLLDDVYQNGEKQYCLQPVVVRKQGSAFELIDGQQRLTTLFLIYKYLKTIHPFFHDPTFSLTYATREKSAAFLNDIDLDRRNENIDFWFMANAYETIKAWFEQDLQSRVMHVLEYLNEQVKIIWYEVGETEDAISLFTRLNIGKIPLTSAELVKAMFLSRDTDKKMDHKEQEEISLQWDNMEKELHNDALWYFLTNQSNGRYQTRIDLVLNLITGKTANDREIYYTFFKFDEMRRTMPLSEIWINIQKTYLILKDWFENHELYHKIGYLIASETLTLQEIFDLSKGRTKTEFRALLQEHICDSVAISGNYSDLSYNKTTDHKKISTLLLLFNVESVRQNGEHSLWFPFDKFKFGKGGKVAWSLEHIHAQQSEGMRTQEVWKEWLSLHIPSVRALGDEHGPLIDEMEKAVAKEKLDGTEFERLQQQVVSLLSVAGNTEYLHSLANLALLNSCDNAALNNSTFDVKRNVIIDMDKKGQYIPFCTKMVFLKYYTPSDKNQLHFWGEADRTAYIDAINTVLKEYLAEPIISDKEQ